MTQFFTKLKKIIAHPQLVVEYLRGTSVRNYSWAQTGGTLKRKKYQTYTSYIRHQQSKLTKIQSTWLPAYDGLYRELLRSRLAVNGVIKPGLNVLCLAARIGTEVKSFLDLGCFAIGIDLNPGKENKYVVYGDFHHLQFPDASVDLMFTNSLDHAFDLPKLIAEMRRVLKPSGFLILEVMKGESEGNPQGYQYYESLSWTDINSLLKFFLQAGFSIITRADFTQPEAGEHVVLARG